MSSGVRAVVAGHGSFAAGLVSAVDQITGRGAELATLSNRDLGGAEIEERLRDHVESGVRVIFTDLPAGSVTLAARKIMRDHPELSLVTGANVAVLLEFVMGDADDAGAPARAVEKGRQALASHRTTGVARAD